MLKRLIYIVSLLDITAMIFIILGIPGALDLDSITIGQAVRNLIICIVLFFLGVVGIKMTWDSLLDDLKDDIDSKIGDIYNDRYPDDRLSEIVDSNVPIYYSDMIEVLETNMDLGHRESQICDSYPTVFDLLSSLIFEALSEEVSGIYDEVLEEHEVECAECGDTHYDFDDEWDEETGKCTECKNKRKCPVCGEEFDVDDYCWNEEKGKCEDCIDEENEREEEEDE
jgi:hypothetical protein